MSENLDAAKAKVKAELGDAVASAREKLALGVLQYGELRTNWMKFRIPIVVGLIVVALVSFYAGTHFRGG